MAQTSNLLLRQAGRLVHDEAVTPVAKSVAVAYVLWFFLGYLGIHRFYCGRVGSGAAMLALTIFGWLTSPILFGHLLLFAVGVWWLIDLFLTAGMATGARP